LGARSVPLSKGVIQPQVSHRESLLRVLKLISKALCGREWLDGVERRIWRLARGEEPYCGDGYVPLLRTALELFHESGGWYVTVKGAPTFVDRQAWDRLCVESRRALVPLP
jgi:hypothetical protein